MRWRSRTHLRMSDSRFQPGPVEIGQNRLALPFQLAAGGCREPPRFGDEDALLHYACVAR